MWTPYIKTVLFTTSICAFSGGLVTLLGAPPYFENFIYTTIMSFGGLFLFPIMLLTWLNSLINKTRKKTFKKPIKILRLILVCTILLFVWLLIDFNDSMRYVTSATKEQSITSKLIHYKEHNDMSISLIYFIPICVMISLFYDKFNKKSDSLSL